jgi:putative hydrolase of the HAD superfamily
MQNIKHIFFDLDRTLWDFETNSRRIIIDLFHEHNLESRCNAKYDAFIELYENVNQLLWDKLRAGEISKQQLRSSRFYNSMQQFGYDDFELGYKLEEEYVKRSPYQKSLMPGAFELLEHLNPNYKLHIITNGFKEVQHIKLEHAEIKRFFDVVMISEEVGVAKPDPEIFINAMEKANALAHESVMIGDDLHVDVRGAIGAGMRAVHLDVRKECSKCDEFLLINSLEELKTILK